MSTVFVTDKDRIAEFVAQLGGKPFHAPYTAIGVHRDGTIIGGFVFTGFNGDAVEMSLAGSGVAKREAWRAVLNYVFRQLKCSRLQMHTRMSNKPVKSMLPRLGIRYEGRARKFYGNEDGCTYSLTIDDLAAFRARWRL